MKRVTWNDLGLVAVVALMALGMVGCGADTVIFGPGDPGDDPDVPDRPPSPAPTPTPTPAPQSCAYFGGFRFLDGPSSAFKLKAGELDGDGRSDLFVGGQPGPSVIRHEPNGGYAEHPQLASDDGGNPVVALADFNGDGHLDLASAGDQTLAVSLGDGSGSFGAISVVPYDGDLATGAMGLEAGDVDGDGHADLVVSDLADVLVVFYGNGDGSFGPGQSFATGHGPQGLALADIDGDGRDEIALALYSDVSSIELYDPVENAAPIAVMIDAGRGRKPRLADFDGDGVLDLAVAAELDGVGVALGLPGGGFAPATRYAIGGDAGGIDVADINGDGALDLVVSNRDVVVLLGDGHGGFEVADRCEAWSNTRDIVLADLNGDGLLDAATTQQGPSPQSVGVMFGVAP